MSDEKTYSVSDLAEEIGVPRTTINDWLAKFSQYVDFKMTGKRKSYTENTLNLLKRVSALRNEDKQTPEIEKILSTEFALHPNPEPPKTDGSNISVPNVAMNTVQPEPRTDPTEEYALIAKRNSEEVLHAIGGRFQMMTEKMDELRQFNMEQRKGMEERMKRARFFSILQLLLVLLVLLGFSLVCAYAVVLRKHFADNREKLERMRVRSEERENSIRTRAEKLQTELEKVRSGLTEQRREFEKAVETARRDFRKAKEAETALAREKFASERLKLLLEKERAVRALEHETRTRKAAEKEEALRQIWESAGFPAAPQWIPEKK